MISESPTQVQLLEEIALLRARLDEAEQTLGAIRSGEVDAVVVTGPQGEQVFSLTGAETVYRLVVETMTESALNVTPEGSILFCNESFGEFVQTPMEALLGHDLHEWVRPEDRDLLRDLLQQCQQHPIKQKVLFRTPDGTLKSTQLTGHALIQSDGISLCLVLTDLTELAKYQVQLEELVGERTCQLEAVNSRLQAEIIERKQGELALRASEGRYHALFDNLTEGFALHEMIYDAQGAPCDYRFLDVNPAYEQLTGLKREAVVGRSYRELRPEDEPHWIRIYGQVVLTGKELHLEQYSPEQQRHHELYVYRPAPGQFAIILQDVTERKQTDEALLQSNARLDLLASTASELLRSDAPQTVVKMLCHKVLNFLDCHVFFNYLVDDETGRLRLNAFAGIPETELHRVEWLDRGVAVCGCALNQGCRIVAENISATLDPRTELVKSFGIQAYACHPLKVQGQVLGTLSFGTRIRSHFTDSELSLMQVVADQVAIALDHQRAQQALRKSNELLEQRVAERTTELARHQNQLEDRVRQRTGELEAANARLQQEIIERQGAEERLRLSLHEKEVMLKEIHHRVKNNLQVISSLVDLQAATLDPAMRGPLQELRNRVRSMVLVHEKLYQSENLARVDFAAYAQSLLNYLWRAYGTPAATIQLKLDLEPMALPIESAVPCGLILNELVANALKHAFRDRPAGEVTVALHAIADDRAALCVRDNGAGLPSGFDWRLSRSLGLRLVQMLTGQLKGSAEVSNNGAGTEFIIRFPVPAR